MLDALSAPVPGVQMLVSWHREMHSMAEKKSNLVNISNSSTDSKHTGRRLVHCAICKRKPPPPRSAGERPSEWGINHNTGSLPAAFDQNWRMSSRTDNRAATAKLRSDYSRDVCISRIIINSAIVLCRQKYSSDLTAPASDTHMLCYSLTVTEGKPPVQKGHVEKVLLSFRNTSWCYIHYEIIFIIF